MESNSKSSNIKSKRSIRKFSVSSKIDNVNDKENGKHLHRKLMLKRRGLYVERNPTKLAINEVFERGTSSKSSQRDGASSILTSSIVGNQGSFIHEEIKTKRRVRKKKSITQRAIGKCKVDSPKSRERTKTKASKEEMKDDIVYLLQSHKRRDLKTSDSFSIAQRAIGKYKVDSSKSRERTKTKASKEEMKDDIVYLLQSHKRRDLKTSDSFKSKRSSDFNDSTFSIKRDENHTGNIPSDSCENGIDRIAAQILQDWMTDKGKETKVDIENPVKTEGGLNDLSQNLPAAAENNVAEEIPSFSKDLKPDGTVLNRNVKRITFNVSDHTDVSIPRDTPRKFHIMECDRKLDKKDVRKHSKVGFTKPVRPKFNKLSSEPRVFSTTNKAARRNGKEFLGIIKRELEKCRHLPEEPRSMFDALKMVARNKHLSKRRISLYLSDTDCQLEPSKLLRTKALFEQIEI